MIKRALKWTGIFVGATLIALMLWEPLTAHAPVEKPYLPHDVKIARDAWGVPHIFGKTDADVAYGVAYAHAEDDFATLQEVIAMTRGRMGALSGSTGAQVDYVAALLDVRTTVDRDYASMPADVRAIYEAYAAGLNHYARKHPGEVRMIKLFPVRGEDAVAGFVMRAPFFYGLDATLAKLASGEDLPREGGPALAPSALAFDILQGDGQNGSNAFAVAPSRMTDGSTRLISNAHQPWTGNVAWYEMVIHSETGWDFAGAGFPGGPFPFVGHNKTIGWTNTVNRPDLIDIYKLTLNADGTAYRLDGKWRPLERRRVWLGVKFGPFTLPVPKTVYRAAQGPVIVNAKGAFAIRYAGIDSVKVATQFFRQTKARNFTEWRGALAGQGVPSFNYMFAGADGTIAYVYNGLFPDRAPGFDWRKTLPGDTSKAIWPGALPFDRVPMLVNPASGYLINANNTPWLAAGPGDEMDAKRFSPLMGIEDDMTNRGRRAVDLFEASGQIDAARLSAIKYDTGYARDGYSATWMAQILALDTSKEPDLAAAQALLRQWDWSLDGKGKGDALALIVLRPANAAHHRRLAKLPEPRAVLREMHDHLMTHFGSLDPPLGTVLRLRRGTGANSVDLPLDGGNDTLRASTLWDVDPDGRLRVRHGDSFVMFMTWDKDGRVSSRSIMPFGAATNRPASPHYVDQAPLFAAHRTKPVLFDPAALMATKPRVYRP
ncbi:MAG: hypothetical protein RLZZ58_1519 [Pseudomonadota bacterium]